MSQFAKVTELRAAGPERFECEIPDGWQQGKGAFGGVTLGILVRALMRNEPDMARKLRALNADLCAVAMPGPAEVQLQVLRRGGSVSFVEARLVQGGKLITRATATLGAPRPALSAPYPPAAPTPKPWADVPVAMLRPPFAPVFTQWFEYRSMGPMPFSGHHEPLVEGWIREAGVRGPMDEAFIVGLLDAWFPSFAPMTEAPRATVTIGYTTQLLVDPSSLPVDEPLFYRGRGVAAAEGYLVDSRELYAGSELIALNQQTVALIT